MKSRKITWRWAIKCCQESPHGLQLHSWSTMGLRELQWLCGTDSRNFFRDFTSHSCTKAVIAQPWSVSSSARSASQIARWTSAGWSSGIEPLETQSEGHPLESAPQPLHSRYPSDWGEGTVAWGVSNRSNNIPSGKERQYKKEEKVIPVVVVYQVYNNMHERLKIVACVTWYG